MSDTMLHGVLSMPVDLWQNNHLDKQQRHSRYVEASNKIKDLEQQLGLTKIALEQKTTLLASCEKALEREQNKYLLK